MKLDKIILTSFAILAAGCGSNLAPTQVPLSVQSTMPSNGATIAAQTRMTRNSPRVSRDELSRLDSIIKNRTAFRNMFHINVREIANYDFRATSCGYEITERGIKFQGWAKSGDPNNTYYSESATRARVREGFLVFNEQLYADREDNGTMDVFAFLSPGSSGYDFHVFTDAETQSRGPFSVFLKDSSGIKLKDKLSFQEIGSKDLFYDRINIGELNGDRFEVFFSNVRESDIEQVYSNSRFGKEQFIAGVMGSKR